MKKIITASLALLLFAGAQAQSKDSTRFHHPMGGRSGMIKELNLTADQQAKLKTLHDAQRKEMEALKTSSLNAEEMKTRRAELHKKYSDQAAAIYTPAQKMQLDKRKAEWKGKAMKHGKEAKGRHGKGDFAKTLNLTQDQKDKMAKLHAESKTRLEALKNDQSLTDAQRKEKMKAIKKDQHAQMKNVLTKEQADKMESLRKEHKRPEKR